MKRLHLPLLLVVVSCLSLLLLMSAGSRAETPPKVTKEIERTLPGSKPTVEKRETPERAAPPAPTPVQTSKRRHQPADFQRGVNLLVYGNDADFQVKLTRELDRLVTLNVNSVSLVTPIWTDSCRASTVSTYPMTLSDDNIALFATESHRRGLTVLLRPLLHEEQLSREGCWRGSLRPADRDRWFASYQELLVHYASLAQTHQIEIFSLGVELNCLIGIGGNSRLDCLDGVDDRPYWREEIIPAVRSVYQGQLIYSINHDSPADSGFWDLLDYVGVDAFYRLDVPRDAGVEEIVKGWKEPLEQLHALSRFSKPVVATEIGTRSEVGSFRQPWLWSHGTNVSLTAQQDYYAASCQAISGVVSGMYFWQTSLDPPANPETDRSFDPIGKPAESEIKKCYGETIP